MGKALRALAIQSAAITAGLVVLVAFILGAVLYQLEQAQGLASVSGLAPWILVVCAVVLVLLAGGIAVWVGYLVAERDARRLLEPLRLLAQRAEEFGSGGFAFDSLTSGEGRSSVTMSGIEEIDNVSRILDRNSRALSRALSAERSFAADASHQLRTPLAALLMRLEEIAQSDSVPEMHNEAVIAISQTERLAGVVDDLLHRTRAGHADGGRSVSLDTVLSTLQNEWTQAFASAGRSVSVTLERGMIVRSSASAISQIMNTLLENALVHGAGDVRVTARRSGPSAVLEVQDEGKGIPDELARRIFERAVSGGGGTGLGLAVARESAEQFGGRLELVQARPVVFALYVSMAPAR
ncbi:sensor histidine kinase [Ornithinicoccus hortensis]|uniref:histidine kinase n=1 Tax=Ornithinicoccus hortensis TaxID=82346 RepID=A0A542YQU3_9MICO|nr:HAMP domain-containing sensor histidine kinase [Ornithinicoccus hortensis]TQL50294.1 signal transduction histidine kinase [Ornithinicoccus hortensis]